MSNQRLRVSCLPVGSRDNPYQHLMMEGLRKCGWIQVDFGEDGKFLAALRTWIRKKPDVIHFDWIFRYFIRRISWWTVLNAPLFLIEVAFVRYFLGCRIVWTLHNIGTHDRETSRLEYYVRHLFAKTCDWIRVFDETTVSRAAKYLGMPEHKFIVIPEGSYAGYYENEIDQTVARDHLGLSKGAFVLCFVGGIRPYKGVLDLVETFLETENGDWRLVVAGNPLDRAYAEKVCSKCSADDRVVCRLEFIPDQELQIYFNAADVIVLPFLEIENSGSVILAMSFGKPVVAPSIGVIGQRLSHQNMLLYSPGNLAQGLKQLIGVSESYLRNVGQANYERVQENRWEDFRKAFEGWEARKTSAGT